MRELPKYALLTDTVGFKGMKVISFERPYIIASIIEISKSQTERLNDLLEDMAQDRYPIAKVQGYSIFLKVYSSLEPCGDANYQKKILRDMADYVLRGRIATKPGQFKGMKDDE